MKTNEKKELTQEQLDEMDHDVQNTYMKLKQEGDDIKEQAYA